MNDIEFQAAQHRYLFAPKGMKRQRYAELQAVVKRLLSAEKLRRECPKRKRRSA